MILAEEEVTTTSSAGDVSWPLADHLGSVRDIIDEDGTVLNHIEYGVYGEIVAETDDTVDHIYGFTGRERDEESGLQYNRARYYDAVLGRWASEDPIGFLAGDPNISRYVGNDPANFVDPSGLDGHDRGVSNSGDSGVVQNWWNNWAKPTGQGVAQFFWDVNPGVMAYNAPERIGSVVRDPIGSLHGIAGSALDGLKKVIEHGSPLVIVPSAGDLIDDTLFPATIHEAEGAQATHQERAYFGTAAAIGGATSGFRTRPKPNSSSPKPSVADSPGPARPSAAAPVRPSSRADLHISLREQGFKFPSTSSPNRYVTYRHPDGRVVTIKPSGEVITTRRVWKADGSGKFNQRIDSEGNVIPDQSHSTGYFVESIE